MLIPVYHVACVHCFVLKTQTLIPANIKMNLEFCILQSICLQVDKHIRKLDSDLARFEAELKEKSLGKQSKWADSEALWRFNST